MRRRPLMALLSGSAAALVMLSVPVPLLEMLVASTGLAEIMPAAAPPLGHTARSVLAGFAGMLGVGLALALSAQGTPDISDDEEDAGEPDKGEGKMGFALSKLTSFTRGGRRRATVTGLEAVEPMPVLRRADSHPDAPARRPIFASRDFDGTEPFTRPLAPPAPDATEAPVETAIPEAAVAEAPTPDEMLFGPDPAPSDHGEGFVMPRAPAPLDDHVLLTEAIVAQDDAVVRVSLDGLSLGELVDRFEQGIARRKALAQAAAASRRVANVLAETGRAPAISSGTGEDAMPVLADIPPVPPVAVRSDVDKDIDAALRAALNSLQQMTGR
ncbi:hypothetical protein [Sphingobium algorifonticola]|nr:hypothetical protein [Sphingobium algorifonticola]